MQNLIELDELRKLKDNENIKGDKGKIFNFMFKKNKLSRIKFGLNTKNVWIFKLSNEGWVISEEFQLCV